MAEWVIGAGKQETGGGGGGHGNRRQWGGMAMKRKGRDGIKEQGSMVSWGRGQWRRQDASENTVTKGSRAPLDMLRGVWLCMLCASTHPHPHPP